MKAYSIPGFDIRALYVWLAWETARFEALRCGVVRNMPCLVCPCSNPHQMATSPLLSYSHVKECRVTRSHATAAFLPISMGFT